MGWQYAIVKPSNFQGGCFLWFSVIFHVKMTFLGGFGRFLTGI